jgi:hypothetical protein
MSKRVVEGAGARPVPGKEHPLRAQHASSGTRRKTGVKGVHSSPSAGPTKKKERKSYV